MKHRNLLAVLRGERGLAELSPAELDLCLRQARAAALLGRLAALTPASERARLAGGAGWQLDAAEALAAANHRSLVWELERLAQALAGCDGPVILLKGAAYAALGLPNARGRLFGDIDLLVPRAALGEVETRLQAHGWMPTHLDAYDQRYYRKWMHELPPFEHIARRSVIDVHHTIVPLTARLAPDTEALIAAAVPVPGWAFYRALAPTDLVLHSATHLFSEGELDHALRDLVDIDLLVRHYAAADPAFVERLRARAVAVGLERMAWYALRWGARLLGTPAGSARREAAAPAVGVGGDVAAPASAAPHGHDGEGSSCRPSAGMSERTLGSGGSRFRGNDEDGEAGAARHDGEGSSSRPSAEMSERTLGSGGSRFRGNDEGDGGALVRERPPPLVVPAEREREPEPPSSASVREVPAFAGTTRYGDADARGGDEGGRGSGGDAAEGSSSRPSAARAGISERGLRAGSRGQDPAPESGAPGRWPSAIMDVLLEAAFRPLHPSCEDTWTRLRRFVLYVRGHWLRMPLPLLALHLAVKATRRKRKPRL